MIERRNRRYPVWLSGALCALSTSCASYQPSALDTAPNLVQDLRTVTVNPSRFALPELARYRFDASDGLDMTEVAMLAVANNPDLKVARLDTRVTAAQAFSAGLLPDPQLALSTDLSNSSGAPDATRAFSAGLSFDFASLLTHATLHTAAQAEARKTDLNLLWQEWQVVAQARVLFVRLTQGARLLALLQENRVLFDDRYQRTRRALELGLVTLDAVAPNLTALGDVEKQINDLERQTNQNRHDLNALLGLSPELVVPLQGDATFASLDETALRAELVTLTRRRPDLVALEAGYAAQDARYRGAILAQFPSLNIGFTRARDASNVYSTALGISLSLPIFNRNRGNIAIESATRVKLHEEYQQRINKGIGEVDRILREQAINQRQLQQVELNVQALRAVADKAERAYRANNLDMLQFANLRASLLSKQIEQASLQQAMLEQRVALQALLGGELPLVSNGAPTSSRQ